MKDSLEHLVKVYQEGYLSYYEVRVGTSISAYYRVFLYKSRILMNSSGITAICFQGLKKASLTT